MALWMLVAIGLTAGHAGQGTTLIVTKKETKLRTQKRLFAPAVCDLKEGDKVTLNMLGESKTLDYKVDGDKVTITDPTEGPIVFTRNSDGTLNSGLGTFAKKE